VKEEYDADESCMRRTYAPGGTLAEVCRIAPPPTWDVEYVWDMTDGNVLVLPEDTVSIGKDAFNGVAADKIKLPAGIQSIAENAVPAGTLLIVPENSSLIDTLKLAGYYYVVVK